MNKLLIKVILFAIIIPSFSTLSLNAQEWKKTPEGLKYRFITKDEKGAHPKMGDMVTVTAYYQAKDTIFFDSRRSPTPYIFPIVESSYPGDIFSGLAMMAVGDSAIFAIDGEKLFMETFKVKSLPSYIAKGSEVLFHVKMLRMQLKEDFQKEMQAKFEAESKVAAELAGLEDSVIKDYMTKNKLQGTHSKSGMYYVEVKKGEGARAAAGNTVKVHYTGKLIDGTVFDSSHGRGEPLAFPLGKNKVIRGWEEGIANMNKGGKAILLIPSSMGYGQGSVGKIPPNSILIFDVELVDFE